MNMCPECGRPSSAEVAKCATCGHALANGTAPQETSPAEKLLPGLNGYVVHKTPPEMIEEAIRTFDEDAFLAELREVERNGGGELKDFIHELEQEVTVRE